MLIVDANVILRIVLNDNELMANEAANVIKSRQIIVKNEVLAEVIYVLTKFYKISKLEVCTSMLKFIEVHNVNTESKDVIICAINTFQNNNLDFVDCILYAYQAIERNEIFTFDKKLKALLSV